MAMLRMVLIGALIMAPFFSYGRSAAVVRQYRSEHACPATGQFKGPCPGYVVDHIIPLCAGGADDPSNMIWQQKAEALEKDKTEWALCRWIDRLQERKAAEG